MQDNSLYKKDSPEAKNNMDHEQQHLNDIEMNMLLYLFYINIYLEEVFLEFIFKKHKQKAGKSVFNLVLDQPITMWEVMSSLVTILYLAC